MIKSDPLEREIGPMPLIDEVPHWVETQELGEFLVGTRKRQVFMRRTIDASPMIALSAQASNSSPVVASCRYHDGTLMEVQILPGKTALVGELNASERRSADLWVISIEDGARIKMTLCFTEPP